MKLPLIIKARYGYDPYDTPTLWITLQGTSEEKIPLETSPTYQALGYTYVGEESPLAQPSLPLPANPIEGRPSLDRLQGFTNDPATFYLYNKAAGLLNADWKTFGGIFTPQDIKESLLTRQLENTPFTLGPSYAPK